jgi:hypothetical protein
MWMDKEDTLVCRADGETNAQQIKALLEVNGIACTFRGEALRTTHGLTLDGLGVVEIHTEPGLVEQAKELIAHAESGKLSLNEEE